mmetsp:Transcript_12894/g.20860  ORF Transcript_12894/g.20860 Transcript_12894/m.20860 type:complete len:156 (+) Transcript_12894:1094-1561(+)
MFVSPSQHHAKPRSIARFKQSNAFRPTPDVKSFEGVASMSFASWRRINGYSNKFISSELAGAGVEDAELFQRCLAHDLIKDTKSWSSGQNEAENRFFYLYDKGEHPVKNWPGGIDPSDGLYSVRYKLRARRVYTMNETRYGKVYSLNVHHIMVDV